MSGQLRRIQIDLEALITRVNPAMRFAGCKLHQSVSTNQWIEKVGVEVGVKWSSLQRAIDRHIIIIRSSLAIWLTETVQVDVSLIYLMLATEKPCLRKTQRSHRIAASVQLFDTITMKKKVERGGVRGGWVSGMEGREKNFCISIINVVISLCHFTVRPLSVNILSSRQPLSSGKK